MSLPEVLAGIRAAEQQAGRVPGSVRLVAVTKGHDLQDIGEHVLKHGDFPLGENRPQELRDKAALRPDLEWHFIGTLQRNKVKYLRPARLVHSLEALWQAEAIAEQAQGWGHAPDVLVQVHNGEVQKHGVPPAELKTMLAQVRATGLTVRGLMVMAPDLSGAGLPSSDLESRILKLFEETASAAQELGLPELSMGMSSDYPLAVRAGATLVRVGRSLFT